MDLYQKRWKRMRISILTLFCLVSVQGICGAADYTWTGGGTDSGWTNPSNWSLGTGYPGSGTGTDTVTIPHLSAGEYPDVPSSVFLKSLTVQSGAQMTVSAPGTRVSVSSVDISGTLTVSDGDFFVHTLTVQDGGIAEIDGGQLDIVSSSETGAPGFLLNRGELRLSSGDIYILGGGAISNQGTIDWKLGSIRLSPEVTDIFTFNNEGLIAVGSGLTGKILADCSFTNTSAGTVRMLSDGENALLAIQSNSANSQFINKGMVSGTGIFDFQPATQVFLNDGDSAVKGSIAPDDGDSLADSYGTLEIRGRFQQTENGQISIEITENASDVLRIGGSTQLAGDLNITGYATGGTFAATYPVVEYGVRSGAFSSVNFSDVPENYAFTAAYADNTTPQSVNISVTSTLPVTRTWAGTVSRNWWLAENWVDSGIPEDGDIVIIPAGTAYNPIFSGINTFQKIDIQGNLEIGVESHLITSEFIVRGGEVLNMGRLEWGYFNSILPVTSPRTDDAPVFISGVVINQGVLNWYEGNIELSGDKEKTGLLINRNDMTIGQSASDGASTDTPVLEIYGPGLFELSSQPDGDGDSYVRLQALELVTGAETLFSVKSGTAEGRGHICVNGFFHWSGGVLEGAAEPPVTGGRPEILINGSGRIFSNDFKKLFGRDLIAGGGSTTGAAIVTVENGSFYLGNESVFEVSAGATLRVDNNASAGMSVFNYDLTGVQLINYGNVTGNGKLAFIPPDDGTSTSLPPIFDNAGTISPGLSPGQLIIEVNEYDNSESTLAVDIVQDSLGNIISDELVIQTPLSDFPPVITLGGTLNITIDPDMLSKLTEGDEFRIITFDPALTSLPAPLSARYF
ncbi:hypothetical protein DENIS_2299 [Desulfonema ishimotonii]|uniref:G8 domain-containing protein n=1 Tax=Desulfonema ishimotonii TaxID=45657 RepID=A0A401FWM3_9BACT|nr:hypothetical protein [Desulfonema ishimotonii]GBC61339.1 hypothetical protein DENIS_2299 [Desulfonema ishimotonii]